jgi:hypothetical protein
MQHRGGKGRGQSILAAGVGAGSERRRASTTATNTGLGSAEQAHTNGTRAPPPLAPPAPVLDRPGGRRTRRAERGPPAPMRATGGDDKRSRWAVPNGHAAVTRQSGIHVRDGTDRVVAARRYGENKRTEGIRRLFFFFLNNLG